MISQSNKRAGYKSEGYRVHGLGQTDALPGVALSSPNCDLFKKNCQTFLKIVYIYNDPLLALLSHFRRNWAFEQHTKIKGAISSINQKLSATRGIRMP